MNRKGYILILMYFSWPVNIVHRIMNNRPLDLIQPFIFDMEKLDSQTYVYGLMGLVSWFMIMWAIWLYITGNYRHDKDFKVIFAAHFINLGIDIPHYILFYQRSEIVIFIQGVVILIAAIKYLWPRLKKLDLCKRICRYGKR